MKILPVFIPHRGCPFQCVYCDQVKISGTTGIHPEKVRKAIQDFCDFNLKETKEIAFYGGTFTNLDPAEIERYLDMVSPWINQNTAIRISTRPDCLNENVLDLCFTRGVRTIELGIQSFADKVLEQSGRGYDSAQAVDACHQVRKKGFRLGIQLMPGLPGFDAESLAETIREVLFIRPEYVRIYPTVILRNTLLEDWYRSEKYHPLELTEAIECSALMSTSFSDTGIKVIKIGLHSDLNPEDIIAGPYHSRFGELVKAYVLKNKILNKFDPYKILVISSKDTSLFRGNREKLIRDLKDSLGIDELKIKINSDLQSGEICFERSDDYRVW